MRNQVVARPEKTARLHDWAPQIHLTTSEFPPKRRVVYLRRGVEPNPLLRNAFSGHSQTPCKSHASGKAEFCAGLLRGWVLHCCAKPCKIGHKRPGTTVIQTMSHIESACMACRRSAVRSRLAPPFFAPSENSPPKLLCAVRVLIRQIVPQWGQACPASNAFTPFHLGLETIPPESGTKDTQIPQRRKITVVRHQRIRTDRKRTRGLDRVGQL